MLIAVLLLAGSSLAAQDAPSSAAGQVEATETSSPAATPHLRVLRQVLPAYPKEALKAKIEGQVVLRAVIADNGFVKVVEALGGPTLLANAAMEAAHQWQFETANVPNTGPGVRTTITMNFDLHGKKVSATEGPQTLYISPPEATGNPEGLQRVGGAVSPPRVTYSPEPEYAKAARKEKFQGTAVLSLIVAADGRARDVRVVHSLRADLDEKAVEAVSRWKFEPALKDGKPVAVQINVQVDFRLY